MERQKEADLTGKVAIVTGSSRGIGKAIALALARRGAKIVVTARTVDPDQNHLPGTIGQTVGEIEALGAEATAVGGDLAEEADLKKIVQATVDRFGGVDLLVNNAAVTDDHGMTVPGLEMSRADWMHHFAVNVHAPFTLMQLVTPIMAARGGGRILNVTTGSGECFRLAEEPPPVQATGDFSLLMPAYFSSKRALDRMANVMTPVLAAKNIYMITMMPGFVASEIALYRIANAGMSPDSMVPLSVPARVMAYFAACADPTEYAGRIFWAERELAELGLSTDE